MKKRILSLMLIFGILETLTASLPITVSAASSGTCGENLTWTLDDSGTLTISGSGEMTDWESYDEAPWYSLRRRITSVTIKSGVTSIGNCTFVDCSSLTSVIIGNDVTSIGDYAFENCENLTSVTIPDSVISIGVDVFYNTAIYNNDENWESNVLYIDNCLIATKEDLSGEYAIKDGTRLIGNWVFKARSGLTSVIIPDSVTGIGDNAFTCCDGLIRAIIPDSVISIGDEAFLGCSSLTRVIIGDRVTSIGSSAFAGCYSLTRVTIPYSVTSIGDRAFYYCKSLTSITVDEDNMNYSSLDGNLFNKDQTALIQYAIGKTDKKYIIPDDVTSIDARAFRYCDSLTSVAIPDSVTSIGNGAFGRCSSLTSVKFPDGVTSIGDYEFEYCYSLTSVTIPDSVTSIGDSAFYGCDSLNTIYYSGTQEQWNSISIGSDNEELENAAIEYKTITNDGNLKIKDLEITSDTIEFYVDHNESSSDSIIYIGIYDDSGKMVDIETYHALECDRVSLKNEGKTLKVMLWRARDMNPLADRIKINLDN